MAVIIFGHRGAPGYPRKAENTKASFRKALQTGADGLEFDVRRCGDGQLVVIHDDTIDRTTNGRGRVREMSYEALRQFDAGYGEPIPLLPDVLDEFGGRCVLNIELKDRAIGHDVKALVRDRHLEQHLIVSAFEWDELRPLLCEVSIGLLSSRTKHLVATAIKMGAKAIHPRCNVVTKALVEAAHHAELKVYTWTVNDAAEISRFREIGVDGVFTDFPERAFMQRDDACP